jgi:hypothetical protein
MPDPNNYTPLDEVVEWQATIPALQDGWPPNGGPVDPANNGGLLNWPLLHLASRTLWLKAQAEQLATDLANIDVSAQINAAIDALVNGAPAALDTLSELAAALQDNDDQVAALVASIAGKLSKDQNLNDLTDVAAARLALQLKSAALRDVTDGDDLSVDGENVALRKNVLAAILANQVGLGIDQTLQDVKASRSVGTVYQNTTDRPIAVTVDGQCYSGAIAYLQWSADGTTWVTVGRWSAEDTIYRGRSNTLIVPPNDYYRIAGTLTTMIYWTELR